MSIRPDGTVVDDFPTSEKLKDYNKIRSKAEALYQTFTKIHCPAFNATLKTSDKEVHFTSEGFNHIIYRIKKQERDKRAQIMRFELLERARELLQKTNTIQEYEEYYCEIKKQVRKEAVMAKVKVRDWGFVGIINSYRIKVVVRQIGSGERKFHSVIPAWETKYYHQVKFIRNTKGNVADD